MNSLWYFTTFWWFKSLPDNCWLGGITSLCHCVLSRKLPNPALWQAERRVSACNSRTWNVCGSEGSWREGQLEVFYWLYLKDVFIYSCPHMLIFSGFQVILSRQYGSEGRFTFTSHTPGEHQICLHSNSSKFALFAGGMLVSYYF